MKGDFSRLTVHPSKHYVGVLHQQGRVWLDADSNADVLSRLQLWQTQTRDILGVRGAPDPGTGFRVSADPDGTPEDFLIANGDYYVDGILAQLESEAVQILSFPGDRSAELTTTTADGAGLEAGQWIEIFDGSRPQLAAQLLKVESVAPEACALSFSTVIRHDLRHGDDPRLRRAVHYGTQPDYPGPPPLPLPPSGRHQDALVYLDVWRRLVTYLEDDQLREVALGGPDTAARLKTIAQVKVLPILGDGEETEASLRRILPKPGRGTLSTVGASGGSAGTGQGAAPDEYTGRENRLYRVEVHNGGDVQGGHRGSTVSVPLAEDAAAGATELRLARPLSDAQAGALTGTAAARIVDDDGHVETVVVREASGTQVKLETGTRHHFTTERHARLLGGVARFKWSRNNASAAVAVTGVSQDGQLLTVASLGRDRETSLRQGDWVEVSNDVTDLGAGSGHLTYLSAAPDADEFTVQIGDPLPPQMAQDVRRRHLKLRRWDSIGWVHAEYDDTKTPDMNLGDGVHVRFGGQDMRVGDYWQFAARAADGSVEPLREAPPAGIIRHVAPLAIVRWSYERCVNAEVVLRAIRRTLSDPHKGSIEATVRESGRRLWTKDEVESLAREAGARVDETQSLLDAVTDERRVERRLVFRVVADLRRWFRPLTEDETSGGYEELVAPGESVSAAVDGVGPEGGVVCLLPGTHRLDAPLRVSRRRRLTLRGVGTSTVVVAQGMSVPLLFERCKELELRDLTIVGGRPPAADDDSGDRGDEDRWASGTIDELEEVEEARHVRGVITFIDCEAVRLTRCTVSCAATSDSVAERACVAFKGSYRGTPYATAEGPAAEPATGPPSRQAYEDEDDAEDDEDERGATVQPVTAPEESVTDHIRDLARRWFHFRQEARPSEVHELEPLSAEPPVEDADDEAEEGSSEEASITVPSESAGEFLSSFSDVGFRTAYSTDLLLRDCRLRPGARQSGVLIADSRGAVLVDNEFVALEAFRDADSDFGEERLSDRPDFAVGLLDNAGVILRTNSIIGFSTAVIASTEHLTVTGNRSSLCGQGLLARQFKTLRMSDNVIEAEDGLALLADSRSGEAALVDNQMMGTPGSRDYEAEGATAAVVHLTARLSEIQGNSFHATGSQPGLAVLVHSNRITYLSNQSVCDHRPVKVNVFLSARSNAARLGTITAIANTCSEPPTDFIAELPRHSERYEQEQLRQIADYMSTASDEDHSREFRWNVTQQVQESWQKLEEWLELRRNRPEHLSMLVSAGLAVTGMNLLTHGLIRLGRGADYGSETGIT